MGGKVFHNIWLLMQLRVKSHLEEESNMQTLVCSTEECEECSQLNCCSQWMTSTFNCCFSNIIINKLMKQSVVWWLNLFCTCIVSLYANYTFSGFFVFVQIEKFPKYKLTSGCVKCEKSLFYQFEWAQAHLGKGDV